MTKEETKKIAELRKQGYGYSRISKAMGISENTIKAYCKRHGLGGQQFQTADFETYEKNCKCCGNPITIIEGRKEKRFCSSHCRNKWWNSQKREPGGLAEVELVIMVVEHLRGNKK